MPTGTRPLPGPISIHVARLITEAIAGRGLRQSDVATEANISASQLSRVLAGTKVFTLDQLDDVCRAVGLDIGAVVMAADEAARRDRGANVVQGRFGVGGHTHTDLETVELDSTKIAASTDDTPIDPSRGEA